MFLFEFSHSFFNMSLNDTGKCKLHTQTITEKYKILKEIDKGETCAAISPKYGIPKQKHNLDKSDFFVLFQESPTYRDSVNSDIR